MPYTPGPSHLPEAFRLADLMRAAGQAQAMSAGSGLRLASNVVGDVGQTVGDTMATRDAAKRQQAENESVAALLASGQPINVGALVKTVGVDRAAQIAKLADAMKPEQPKTREVEIRNADGTVTKRIVADTAGQEFTSAADPKLAVDAAERAAKASAAANELGMRQMSVDALNQPGADPLAVKRQYFSEIGKQLPAEVLPPKPEKQTTHLVTVPGPNGRPVTRLATEEELKNGVETYRAPTSTVNVNAPTPGDFTLTGEEFLKTLPKDWQTMVRKVANYDEDPTRVVGMRGGAREQLMKWVNQYRPDYDASAFSTIAPTRKAFTTGVQGRQINALNTAIGHIDQMTNLADQLDNGGFVPANKAWNNLRTMFGSDKVTNFDTLKDALGGEIAGVLAQNGATVSAIQDAKSHISNASSAKQLAGYIKTQIPILGSKLASLTDAYRKGMSGHDAAYSALSDASKAILKKHGFDPEHPEIGALEKPSKRYSIIKVE